MHTVWPVRNETGVTFNVTFSLDFSREADLSIGCFSVSLSFTGGIRFKVSQGPFSSKQFKRAMDPLVSYAMGHPVYYFARTVESEMVRTLFLSVKLAKHLIVTFEDNCPGAV